MALSSMPLIASGDASNPEIEDKDAEQQVGGNPMEGEPLTQQTNIRYGWFGDELINSFKVTIQTKRIEIVPIDLEFGLGLRNIKQYTAKYYIFFKSTRNNGNYFVKAMVETRIDITNPQNIIPQWHFYIGTGDTVGNAVITANTTGEINNEDATISILVPKEIIGSPYRGDSLTNTYAETQFEAFGVIATQRDRAPDEGYGRDYIFKYDPTIGTVELKIDGSSSKTVSSPGGTAVYKFTLTNTGNDDADISMMESGTLPSGWDATFDRNTVHLGAGKSTQVNLTVKTSSDAQDGETSSLTVRGKYEKDGKDVDTQGIIVTTTLKIQQSYSVSLSTSTPSKKCNPGKYEDFSITVKNSGSKEDTIQLSVEDKDGGLIVEIDKTEVKLTSKGTETINVKISVPIEEKEGNLSVVIKAVSKGDSSKTDKQELIVIVTKSGNYGKSSEGDGEKSPFDMNKIITIILLALIIAVVIVAYAVWKRGAKKIPIVRKEEVSEFKEVKKTEGKKEIKVEKKK